ncbi:hypothetical protein WI99_15100 [Burkholderia cepacia]|uniref:hypothetical protein n=1 Tax=Burkholderia cepacia TaxID=292 RepID=UPI000759D764|nr:hypothetical protein [Burkholderia cepacia]KVE86833.1 hypothetical protein WI99_15100 [Burkholderia cepacia]
MAELVQAVEAAAAPCGDSPGGAGVFENVNAAKRFICAFSADFRQAALGDRQAALEAQRDNSGLFR